MIGLQGLMCQDCSEKMRPIQENGFGRSQALKKGLSDGHVSACIWVQVMLVDPPGSSLFNKVKRGVLYAREEAEGKRLRNPFDTITEGIGINRITANFSRAKVCPRRQLHMSQWLLERINEQHTAFRTLKMMDPSMSSHQCLQSVVSRSPLCRGQAYAWGNV